jgi:hypothetical protein
MTSRPTNPLKSILHPYIFILKEGKKIKKDYLDYSLMILFIHSHETLRSPTSTKENCLREQAIMPKNAI